MIFPAAHAHSKHYKTGQIALRWRVEDEVIERTGELTCGNLRCEHHRAVFEPDDDPEEVREICAACSERRMGAQLSAIRSRLGTDLTQGNERPLVPVKLSPYQVDFAYVEDGAPQRALVKLILCESCARKLTYKSRRDKRARDEPEDAPREGSSRCRSRSRSPRRRSP